ncbi:molecular chaperone Hsp33 [Thiopseudomonas alkaliphila]|uniref:33 kDa chaperonin n=1 Tax=Thiopseudomonas alkaliphila TaxID=1697053 RepID=A0A0K1XFH3_9GAMM|nr:Hsp33 family molecular chaperone HslO [Thiopseudomonas alkaliphila]AKX59932.1 molecular chaperone Hsp33 [Thiopseudomonas alkaliphila]
MHDKDFTQRFLFEDADVRGELAQLDQTYQQVLQRHAYPPAVAVLLGELLAAAALLVGTLKFDGLLTLQARSEGLLSLLMVECSSEREMRAIARYDQAQLGAEQGFKQLMPNGIMAMTIEPKDGQRYQGLVAFEGETLADSLNAYFANSEQLGSHFWLAADGQQARGFLLQQLPVDRVPEADQRQQHWEHVLTLAQTLTKDELFALDNATILHRLYHEENILLFDPAAVRFNCSCSRERSIHALVSLGREDVEALLKEKQDLIEIDCQFCNERYLFDGKDVAQIFEQAEQSDQSQTVH